VPILYVLIPVIPAKFCRYLPVLKSPEYRKTGFGIAGIGNTTWNAPEHVDSGKRKMKIAHGSSVYQLKKKRDFYFINVAKIGKN
jgi:hypothetical protein